MTDLFVKNLPGTNRITFTDNLNANPAHITSICLRHQNAQGLDHLPRSRIGIKKAGFFEKLFGKATKLTFAEGQSSFKDNQVWVNTNSLKKFIFEWSGHAEFFNSTSLQLEKGASWKGYKELKVDLNYHHLNKSDIKKAQDVAYSVFNEYYKDKTNSLNGSSLINYAADALRQLNSNKEHDKKTLQVKKTSFQHVFNKHGPIVYRCHDVPSAMRTYFTVDSYLNSTHSWPAIFDSIKNPKNEESTTLLENLDQAAPTLSRRSSNSSEKSDDASSCRSLQINTEDLTKKSTSTFSTKKIIVVTAAATVTGIVAGPAAAAVAAGIFLAGPKVTQIAKNAFDKMGSISSDIYDNVSQMWAGRHESK